MYFLVIDANVWVKYARAKSIAPLLDRFISYGFVPIVSNYLLAEVFDALVGKKWMHKNDALNITRFIKNRSYFTTESVIYRLSPDPKDNYLIDLAVQNNCVFIISDDSQLSIVR